MLTTKISRITWADDFGDYRVRRSGGPYPGSILDKSSMISGVATPIIIACRQVCAVCYGPNSFIPGPLACWFAAFTADLDRMIL